LAEEASLDRMLEKQNHLVIMREHGKKPDSSAARFAFQAF
jgi:hypothetical protein